MVKSNKTPLAHFPETEIWLLLRPIDTAVVEHNNEFKGSRLTTVSYDSDIQVPAKHEFSETFEREKFDGDFEKRWVA